MKKLFLIMSALLMVFVLAACATTTAADPSLTVLDWNIGAEPQTIDPTLNGASDGGDVINQTFEGLTREVSGVVKPGIASSWETSTDGLTVTFHLRASKWSDGSDLTADDFIYAWKRGMDPRTASEYAWIWEYTNIDGAVEAAFFTDICNNTTEVCNVYNDDDELVGEDRGDGKEDTTGLTVDEQLDAVQISSPDDLTLVIKLTQRTEYIVSLLSFYHFMPIKESAVGTTANGEWAINPDVVVSNGAFVLSEYTAGDGLVLVKNDHYWDAENVHLTKINGAFNDNDATAYYSYQQEQYDVIPSVPAAMVPTLVVEDPEFYVFALLGTYYANFNMDDPILANAKVRKALTYSINREEICEALSSGQIPATGFVPVGFTDHDGADFFEVAGTFGMATDDANYTLANTLLGQAATELGLTLAALKTELSKMVYLYNTGSGHQMVAEMMQADWEANLGIEIALQNQDWATFQESRQNGDYDIARGGWLTDYMDPSGMLAIFTAENAYNDPNYDSEAFDTAIANAMAATTAEAHFDGLQAAQVILMNDMPIIPIYYYSDTVMVQDYVKDWDRSVLGTIDLTRVYKTRG